MSVDNRAVLFLGYQQFEVLSTNPLMDGDEVEKYLQDLNCDRGYYEHGSILYRPIVWYWSSSHEEFLIGVLLGESGSYKSVQLCMDDLMINVPVHRERLRDIFNHREPKLYLFNQQD